jgi:hypothetical protein
VASWGWLHEFQERCWEEVRTFLQDVEWKAQDAGYLFDIIDSVVLAGADELLGLTTSMHDLLVAPQPLSRPPLDVVIVRAPGSLRAATDGMVRIEHLSAHGHTDIVRPVDEAVPLFWRFVDVEFGVRRHGPELTT